MPLINYDLIPYEDEISTGEHVVKNSFYMPGNKKEAPDMYREYYEYDFGGLEIESIRPGLNNMGLMGGML